MVQTSNQSTVNKIEMRLRGKGRGINPSVEDIAQAIAKRDKAKTVPMGAEVRITSNSSGLRRLSQRIVNIASDGVTTNVLVRIVNGRK